MKKFISILLSLILCLSLSPVQTFAADTTDNLDFSQNGDQGNLETNGYCWDDTNKKLQLKDITVRGAVTLPDDTVTIDTTGNCSIDTLSAGDSPQNTKLIFSGEGTLTIKQRININGNNGLTITVNEKAKVIASSGISIGASGGVDSTITVNGILTAMSATDNDAPAALSAGKVIISDTGKLYVSGANGVQLNGMNTNGGGSDFTGVFTIIDNGCFTANCSNYNILVSDGVGTGNQFPKDSNGNTDANAVINVPADSLPTDCGIKEIKNSKGQINLVRKDPNTDENTDIVYTGLLIIHQNHIYSGTWTYNDTHHWNACTFEGCNWKQNYAYHTPIWEYDKNNHWQKCSICSWKSAPTNHSYNNTWQSNENGHWQKCTACSFTTQSTIHIYDNDADTTCNTCGYVRTVTPPSSEHTHSWATAWTTDATHHWHECTVAGCNITENSQKDGYAAHVYDDDSDETCNTCGYKRTVGHTHTWSDDWSKDGTYHWHDCTNGCNEQNDKSAHIYDNGRDTDCNICGYERTIVTPPVPPDSGGSGGGGGGIVTYAITVEKSEHGKVTSDRVRAGSGSTVTLTVAPDDGYSLNTLTVTDSKDNEIKLTDKSGGKYTFTMPARAVKVNAAFSSDGCDGGPNCPSRAFSDLDTSKWYHESVDFVLLNDLMHGYGNGLFGPNDNVTRAQFVQIIHNKEGNPAAADENIFIDVAAGAWYAPAVAWAAEHGIVEGYGNGKFGPDDNITREQLAVMLWRYAGSPTAADDKLNFNDADKISDYAVKALQWAAEQGIVQGKDNGNIDPKSNATRAETAAMFMRFLNKA